MTQQYSLRWNNHQPNFISEFASLLDTKTLVDVTLAAEGRHILAHKLVLSACSTYFHSLFVDNPSNHPIVILKDVTFANLRTMVDFIYRGEVNVAEDQLEKVLETAKTLKIKGLTEMPETTSVMRSQAVEYQHQHQPQPQAQPPSEPEHQPQPSPGLSPTNKRRRIASPSVEQVREPASLSSLPQRRHIDDTHETQQLNMDTMSINTSGNSLQEHDSAVPFRCRRVKYFKRQGRVQHSEPDLPKQMSDPGPSTAPPPLQRNQSHPPPCTKTRRPRAPDPSTLLIRAVAVLDRQPVTTATVTAPTVTTTVTTAAVTATSMSFVTTDGQGRASHTPAVRAGPPLSCNFCWNTLDECGRIQRRKTQYHCPECRTNLCIVPCFHEYHDAPAAEPVASAR